MAKKKGASAAKEPRKLKIKDMELVIKRSVLRRGFGANESWRQTYTGGMGTPREHDDLDCES